MEKLAVNNSLLEEGLGSIYDMTDEGYSDSDSDSEGAYVFISGRKTEVRLGQGGWSSQNYEMNSVVEMRDTGGEAIIELEIKDQDDTFLFKLFTQKKIGRVSYKKGRSRNFDHLATSDCSGVKDLRDR